MLLPGEKNPQFWLFITILVTAIIAFSESEAKTLDIQLGFDLTQGSNGAPSIRIRGFQGTREFNPRAVDDASSSDDSGKKKGPRGDSSDSEERDRPKKDSNSSKEPAKAKSSDSSESDNSNSNEAASREDKLRSTRGMKAADIEPEEDNPKIHGRGHKGSGSDGSNDG